MNNILRYLKDFPHVLRQDSTILDILTTHATYTEDLQKAEQQRREQANKRVYKGGKRIQ